MLDSKVGRPRRVSHPRSRRKIRPSVEVMDGRILPTGVIPVYAVQSDWGTGFQAQLSLNNTDAAPVADWRLEFDLAASIGSAWDAQLVSHVGNHYVMSGLAWDKAIPGNASLAFGFVASPGGPAPSPTNYRLNGVALGTTPQLPGVSVADATANVGAGTGSSAVFTVGLSAAATSTVTVAYATADGTAKSGVDYAAASGTLTFATGEKMKTVAVAIPAAPTWKADAVFALNLSTPKGATLSRATASGTIHNLNAPPASSNVTFANTSDWGSGFTGEIRINNPGATALNDWTLGFDFAGSIGSIWNGTIASHVGNHYVVKPETWNTSIAAGSSVTIGFNATPGNRSVAPTNFVLSPTPGGGIGGGGGTSAPPVAGADKGSTFAGVPIKLAILANDTDPNNSPLSIASVAAPGHGAVVVNADATVTYTSNPGFLGDDTFTYTIKNATGATATALVTVTVLAAPAPPTWTPREFSPYVDMTLYPTYDLVSAANAAGIKDFTLGFIVADPAKQPAWGGYAEYEVNGGAFDQAVRNQINALRAAGGDVVVSFGGASNQELAEVITDATTLKNSYRKVIDAYNLTHVDFDVEGGASANRTVIDRRSAALALLQKELDAANKPLEIWLTLPVLPTGLTADGLYIVQSALKAGVRLGGVNVMAMDYGDSAAPDPKGHMGDYAIQAGTSLFNQLRAAYGSAPTDAQLWSMVGVTPMIGMNDVQTEIFDQAAARQLAAWAKSKGVGRLAMWSVNRDRQNPNGAITYVETTSSSIVQQPYEFSKIFQTYVA